MQLSGQTSSVIIAAVYFLLASAGRADAYIDPGTGSYLFQLLLGGILAGGFVIKVYWRRLVAFFSRKGDSPDDEE